MFKRESVWGKFLTKAFVHSQDIDINKYQIEDRNTIYTLQPNTQDEEKENKNTTLYVMDTTMHKQTQKT